MHRSKYSLNQGELVSDPVGSNVKPLVDFFNVSCSFSNWNRTTTSVGVHIRAVTSQLATLLLFCYGFANVV